MKPLGPRPTRAGPQCERFPGHGSAYLRSSSRVSSPSEQSPLLRQEKIPLPVKCTGSLFGLTFGHNAPNCTKSPAQRRHRRRGSQRQDDGLHLFAVHTMSMTCYRYPAGSRVKGSAELLILSLLDARAGTGTSSASDPTRGRCSSRSTSIRLSLL